VRSFNSFVVTFPSHRRLAGLAVGYGKGMDDGAANWALDREFRPAMPKAKSEKLYAGWKKAVGRSLDWES